MPERMGWLILPVEVLVRNTAEQVVRRLGAAPETNGDWWSYGYSRSKMGEHNGESEEFTTTNLLELRVEAEAMRAIQASQVSAY
jgi:hypothetical protein